MGSKRKVNLAATADTVVVIEPAEEQTQNSQPVTEKNTAQHKIAESKSSKSPKKVAKSVQPTVTSKGAVDQDQAATETSADAKSPELANEIAEGMEAAQAADQVTASKVSKKVAARSHRYNAARAQVDKTKLYDPFAAVELMKRLSYSKFPGTVSVDGMTKALGDSATLSFPHTTGKTVRAVVVTDEVIAQIEQGVFEFDILICEPRLVPKLAKHAKVLGPKGLMPNPKNGTVTNNPELKKKELEGGKITLKTEKKQQVFHVVIGKTTDETQDLVANIQAVITAFGIKLARLAISATMSPGIKVKIG